MLKLYKLITYSGWIAFTLFVIAVYFIVVGKNVKMHMHFAMAGFVFVLIHIGLTLYPKLKRR